MIEYAIGIFVLTALGGVVLAVSIFKGNLAPWSVSFAHAGLGAAGLILVLMAVMSGPSSARVSQAVIVLVIAAAGGFYLASIHGRKKLAPIPVVVVHAVVAALGLGLLVSSIL